MPKISIFNFILGFALLFLSSAGGAFLGNLSTFGIFSDKALLSSWLYILLKSAHAHTNLFGMIHILFGLTAPYSFAYRHRFILKLQTLGFASGSFAMSALMCVRAFFPLESASLVTDTLTIITGFCLTLWLMSLVSHIIFLAKKLIN